MNKKPRVLTLGLDLPLKFGKFVLEIVVGVPIKEVGILHNLQVTLNLVNPFGDVHFFNLLFFFFLIVL